MVPSDICPCEASLITGEHICLDILPSGRWVESLTERFSNVTLFTLGYAVIWKDGTLNWSRVTNTTLEGVLLELGQRVALFDHELAERRRAQRLAQSGPGLRTGDPFAERRPKAAAKAPRKQTGAGRGRSHVRRQDGSASAGAEDERRSAASDASAHGAASAPLADEGASLIGAPSGADVVANEEYDVFDLDAELEGLVADDLQELSATFGEDGAMGSLGVDTEGLMPEAPVDATTIRQLEEAVAAEAEAVGMEQQPAEPSGVPNAEAAAQDEGPTTAPGAPQPQGEQDAPAPGDEARVVGPSDLGYVSLDGRVVMRILRGNPKGSLSVRCYRHTSCSFLLSLRDAPSDTELVKWLFEVPPAPAGSANEQSKVLGRRHVGLADRWRSSRRRGAAGSGAAAGSRG